MDRLLNSLVSFDMTTNLKKIKRFCGGDLNKTDEYGLSILHALVDKKHEERKCLLAIQTLLEGGISPNLTDNTDYNFIQTALYTGYSETFILECTKEALKYGLNVNHVDEDGDTIIHTAIYSEDYCQNIENLYKLLLENNFNAMIKDKSGKTIEDALKSNDNHCSENLNYFLDKYYPTTNQTRNTESLLPNATIPQILSTLDSNYSNNLNKIKRVYSSSYRDEYGQSLLHLFVENIYDEEKALYAIKTLLENGLDPNLVDNCNINFIQCALYAGYSETFILECTKEALKYGLNVNHVDEDGDTIIHTAISCDDYSGEVSELFRLLCKHGFNPHIKNNDKLGIDDVLFVCGKYSNIYKRKLIHEFDVVMSETQPPKRWFKRK